VGSEVLLREGRVEEEVVELIELSGVKSTAD
jgi:hypothetical protein